MNVNEESEKQCNIDAKEKCGGSADAVQEDAGPDIHDEAEARGQEGLEEDQEEERGYFYVPGNQFGSYRAQIAF